jgi:hypothetical protein
MKYKCGKAIFDPNLFTYKYTKIPNPSYTSYLLAYEDGTDTVFQDVGV